jgi:protein-disulfide isomerase
MRQAILAGLLLLAAVPARADEPCQELAKAVDFSRSPTDDRRVFCTYAKDLVVGSCCQSSLYDCLEKHPDCAQGKALATVGQGSIASGETEEKALAAATRYLDVLRWAKRSKLDLAGAPCRGSGPITVAEFSDFDCPHCAYSQGTVDKLLEERPDVHLCVLAFPIHPHSHLAAAAALFAAKQGKYWEMSHALYSTQEAREGIGEDAYVDQLVGVGKGVGLDDKALRAALKDSPELDLAKAQGAQARKLDIQGTPTFFVDGRMLDQIGLPLLQAAVADEVDWRKSHPPPAGR